MSTATEPEMNLFEQSFNSVRKATEAALQMQQEVYSQWARMWPGFAPAQNEWSASAQKFQRDWGNAVTEIMRKHQSMLDQQYRAGIKSLEEAFHAAESKDPEEMRDRYQSLCRNALDLLKETSESQIRQFQEATNKWIELCQVKR
jgi:hypothetical protein